MSNTNGARARKWAISLGAVALLVVLFSLPSVQAAAANFLGLFRVQQIAVVEFDPANLSEGLDSTFVNVEQLMSDQVTYSEPADPVSVADFAEAEALVDFDVRWPKGELAASRITVQDAGWVEMTIDLEQIELILNELGQSDLVLPASVDGEQVRFSFPESVTAALGDCPMGEPDGARVERRFDSCTMFVQMPSPSIAAPPELPVQDIGQAFLQLFGMSAEDAETFSNEIDWTTTLVIPVPSNFDYRSVQVDGSEATLFEQPHGPTDSRYSLIWVRDGIVYALSGVGSIDAVIALADSLH